MNKIYFILTILISFSLLQAEENPKGIVSYLDGRAKKKMINQNDWDSNVKTNAVVQSREVYMTMKKSKAELKLSGLDIIRLAPKTTIDILALYEESLDGKTKTNIKLQDGEIWAQVNSADDENEFEMDTDISGAAITGTNFRMSKDGKLTKMKVYHGEVKISNSKVKLNDGNSKIKSVDEFKRKEMSGPEEVSGPEEISGPKEVSIEEWIYAVKNMQQITFDSEGNVVSAGSFKLSDQDEKTDWIKWNKKMDRNSGLK